VYRLFCRHRALQKTLLGPQMVACLALGPRRRDTPHMKSPAGGCWHSTARLSIHTAMMGLQAERVEEKGQICCNLLHVHATTAVARDCAVSASTTLAL
jgi:hypothetical protein